MITPSTFTQDIGKRTLQALTAAVEKNQKSSQGCRIDELLKKYKLLKRQKEEYDETGRVLPLSSFADDSEQKENEVPGTAKYHERPSRRRRSPRALRCSNTTTRSDVSEIKQEQGSIIDVPGQEVSESDLPNFKEGQLPSAKPNKKLEVKQQGEAVLRRTTRSKAKKNKEVLTPDPNSAILPSRVTRSKSAKFPSQTLNIVTEESAQHSISSLIRVTRTKSSKHISGISKIEESTQDSNNDIGLPTRITRSKSSTYAQLISKTGIKESTQGSNNGVSPPTSATQSISTKFTSRIIKNTIEKQVIPQCDLQNNSKPQSSLKSTFKGMQKNKKNGDKPESDIEISKIVTKGLTQESNDETNLSTRVTRSKSSKHVKQIWKTGISKPIKNSNNGTSSTTKITTRIMKSTIKKQGIPQYNLQNSNKPQASRKSTFKKTQKKINGEKVAKDTNLQIMIPKNDNRHLKKSQSKTSNENNFIATSETKSKTPEKNKKDDLMADPKIEGSLLKNTTYAPQKETSTILNGRVVNSTSKIPRLTSRFNNKMSSTDKSVSALNGSKYVKTPQQDNALKNVQTEGKMRKWEEKQSKIQKQREQQENKRILLLEQQKIKEERLKQFISQKNEKRKKMYEKVERKRRHTKEKANTIKKQRQFEKEREEQPEYMISETPLIDIDAYSDDEYPSVNNFLWNSEKEMQEALFMQGPYEKIFNNTLFSYGQPNLKEIFVIIDPKKLERSSSALWQKCPRCMLKSPADQISIVEDEEDDSN